MGLSNLLSTLEFAVNGVRRLEDGDDNELPRLRVDSAVGPLPYDGDDK